MRRHRPLILASVVAVAAFSLFAVGCGGGGSPGVASVASSTTAATTTAQNRNAVVVAFSHCMRSHGVPNFPDPSTVNPQALKAIAGHLAESDPRFGSAARACNHLLPNGGSSSQGTAHQQAIRLADALSFARCMRSHGVSRFPDPSAQSGLSVEMVQAQGIDVHSPAFLRVVQACLPASHGALTPAGVREALNHAGS
jgi:hypothetical protein